MAGIDRQKVRTHMSQEKRPTGLYRIRNEHGGEDEVYVTDGTMGMAIPESRYRDKGYQPPVATLPDGQPGSRHRPG